MPTLRYDINDKHHFSLGSQFQMNKTELDNYGSDNTSAFSDYDGQFWSLKHSGNWSKRISSQTQLNYLNVEREDFSLPYSGDRYQLLSVSTLKIENHTLLAGIDLKKDILKKNGSQTDSNQDKNISAIFFKHDLNFDKLNFDYGARWSKDEFAGDSLDYSFGFNIDLLESTIKAQTSTGFMGPSLYQTFSSFGNQSLKIMTLKFHCFKVITKI